MVRCSGYRKNVCPKTCSHLGSHKPNRNCGSMCDSGLDFCGIINKTVICRPTPTKGSRDEAALKAKLTRSINRRKNAFAAGYKAICLKHGCCIEADGHDGDTCICTEIDKNELDRDIERMLS